MTGFMCLRIVKKKMAGICEQGNETPDSTKRGEFFD